jgi:hypothetical protein
MSTVNSSYGNHESGPCEAASPYRCALPWASCIAVGPPGIIVVDGGAQEVLDAVASLATGALDLQPIAARGVLNSSERVF